MAFRPVYYISKTQFPVRRLDSLNTGQTMSTPISYEEEGVFYQINNEAKDEEQFAVFETFEEAEAYSERMALDNYFIDRNDNDYLKAAYICGRGDESKLGEPYSESLRRDYVKSLATPANYASGKCERMASYAVVKATVPVNISLDEVSKKDFLFISDVSIKEGNERIRFNAERPNKSFAHMYNAEHPHVSYMNMLRQYNKGPCCGLFRHHKSDALTMIATIGIERWEKDNPEAAKSLIKKLKTALYERKLENGIYKYVKPSGHYAQCLRDIIELETKRLAEMERKAQLNPSLRSRHLRLASSH